MKKKLIVLAVLLAAVLVTGYSVAGTYAKYTSTFTGTSDTAKIAKWKFTVDETEGTVEEASFDFEIFKNAQNEKNNSLISDTDNDSEIIAPGSKGWAVISLKNESDVKANISLALKATGTASTVPLKYTLILEDSGTKTPPTESFEGKTIGGSGHTYTLAEEAKISEDTLLQNFGAEEKKLFIVWEWPYEDGQDGKTDTALGIASANANRTDYILNVTVTATQAPATAE